MQVTFYVESLYQINAYEFVQKCKIFVADGSEKLEDVLERMDWQWATKIIVAKPEIKASDKNNSEEANRDVQ